VPAYGQSLIAVILFGHLIQNKQAGNTSGILLEDGAVELSLCLHPPCIIMHAIRQVPPTRGSRAAIAYSTEKVRDTMELRWRRGERDALLVMNWKKYTPSLALFSPKC